MKIEKELPPQIRNIVSGKEKKGPCRVFIDIGCGPFPIAFSGNRDFKGNDYFVGIDRDKEEIKKAFPHGYPVENAHNLGKVGENVFFMESDVRNLPFPDASVDEVFLGNVLGFKGINDVGVFLEQAERVLKPGGTLIILETVSAHIAESRDENGVINFIEKFGFTKEKEIRSGDPDFEKEIAKYAQHWPLHSPEEKFIIYLRKKVKK